MPERARAATASDRGTDGDPDGGRRLARGLVLRLSAANVTAAVLAAVLAWLVVPGARPPEEPYLLLTNVVVLASYVLVAVVVAHIVTTRRVATAVRALSAPGGASVSERRGVLRLPLRITGLIAAEWAGALVVLGTLNATYSSRFGVATAVTILCTGLAMCSVAHLETERRLRPLTIAALADGELPDVGVLGAATRQLLGWLLGTGSAIIGLLVIGAVELAYGDQDEPQLAVAVVVFCALALLGGLAVELLLATALTTRLRRIRTAFGSLRRGDLGTAITVDDAGDVGRVQTGVNLLAQSLRDRERLRDAFGRHVGDDVAEHALTPAGARLGGTTQNAAVLFVDVTGSTRLAAERPADEVVELLNRFFQIVVTTVEGHGGSINKFQGDAVLAVFGAPTPSPSAATDALATARTLRAALTRDIPELGFGAGVSGGPVIAGNVGAEQRLEYTVIGDPVNEAARLSDLAKDLPGTTAAAGRLLDAATPREIRHWHEHDRTMLRGRTEQTTVMTLRAGSP